MDQMQSIYEKRDKYTRVGFSRWTLLWLVIIGVVILALATLVGNKPKAQAQVGFSYDIEIPMSDRFTMYVAHVSEGDIVNLTEARDYLYIVDNTTGMRVFYDGFLTNVAASDITFAQNNEQSDNYHENWNIKVARGNMMRDVTLSLFLPIQPGAQTLVDY
jgi:L-arabinose isomerase